MHDHHLISEQCQRVTDLVTDQIEANEDSFLLDRKYKSDREWWILCKACRLLDLAGMEFPIYARKCDPPNPDFKTMREDGKLFFFVEVSEVITERRRRGDEIKKDRVEPKLRSLTVPNDGSSFKRRLSAKMAKRYGQKCQLVLYHNEIFESGLWHETLLESSGNWNGAADGDLNLQNSPFERILAINSRGDAMVELYPRRATIAPARSMKITDADT